MSKIANAHPIFVKELELDLNIRSELFKLLFLPGEYFLRLALFLEADVSLRIGCIILQIAPVGVVLNPMHKENTNHLSLSKSVTLPHTYLAISYCLTVAMVSSMVLLQRVLTDDTKKLRALIKTCPFLVKLR